MLKKKLFSLFAVILMFATLGLTGCTKTGDAVTIDVNVKTITIVMGEQPEIETWELNTYKFSVETNIDTQVLYRIENEGVITVSNDAERSTASRKIAIVKALKTGTAKIIVFTPDSSKVSKEIIVNVVQPITELNSVGGYTLFVPLGQKGYIDVDKAYNIKPLYGNKADLRFSIISDPSLSGATIDEVTGEVDATNITKVCDITVRAAVNEEVYADVIVKLVKPIVAEDVSVLDDTNMIILANGNFAQESGNEITLVKTVEQYSTKNIKINVDSISDYEIKYIIENERVVKLINLGQGNYQLKALGVVDSTNINFSINLVGAKDLQPYEFTLNVMVCDRPLDIYVNGQSTKDNEFLYETNIYNNYQTGILGTAFRFTLSPNSVLEEDSDITITFENPRYAVTDLIVVNRYGDSLGVKYDQNGNAIEMEPFTIKAGDVIYIKSPLRETNSQTYSFSVVSDFTKIFGPELSATVRMTLREGISQFGYEKTNLYLTQGSITNINLTVGNENADTSGIYYDNPNDIISIIKQYNTEMANTSYVFTADKVGDTIIKFFSGNGYEITFNIKVYIPIKEEDVIVSSESPNENGAIGQRAFDVKNGSLDYIAVASGSKFKLFVNTNLGASVHNIAYIVEKGESYINVNSEGLVNILGIGNTAVIRIEVYGYESYGPYSEPIVRKVRVDGYVPISSIVLNSNTLALKDYESVGYHKVSQYSQKQIAVSIYPSNASVDATQIEWVLMGEGGTIDKTQGYNTTFTAGPLGDYNMSNLQLLVRVSDHGREYTQVCNIEVTKAIKVQTIRLANIFNNDLYFDGRKGLNTPNNRFFVDVNTYPSNAFNSTLRYMYYPKKDVNNNFVEETDDHVFKVSQTGEVIPLKGGEATLRIAAEDSFEDKVNPSVYVDIRVVVADGNTIDTAYRVYNGEDLKSIGNNVESLKSFYVLANDIDLSSYKEWEPIGLGVGTFSGYLSGSYVAGYSNNQATGTTINSKIYGLKLNKLYNTSFNKIVDTEDRGRILEPIEATIAGLFGLVDRSAQLKDISLQIESLDITTEADSKNLYVGGLVANVYQLAIEDFTDVPINFENISIKYKNYNLVVKHKVHNEVVGEDGTIIYGVLAVGGIIGNASEYKGMVSFKDCVVNCNQMNIYGNTITNKIDADYFYVGGLIGNISGDLGEIKGTYTQLTSNNAINYGNVFGNVGYNFVGNIIITDELINNNDCAVGGLVGYACNTSIYNTGSHGIIDAGKINNVGGLVGKVAIENMIGSYIEEVTTFGKVIGNNNVGGLVGYFGKNISSESDEEQILLHIYNAIVENYGDKIAIGKDAVGGLIGVGENGAIVLTMVTSGDNTENVSGVTNVGTLIGYDKGLGDITASYTDIKTNKENIYMIGGVANGQVSSIKFSFVTQGAFGENGKFTATNSYVKTNGNREEICNALNGAEIKINLWSTDDSNAITIKWINPAEANNKVDSSVNDGYPIFGVDGQLPFFNVIPTSIEISIKTSDEMIMVNENNILLYYYALDESLVGNINPNDLIQIRQNTLKLNTLNLNEIDFVSINVEPKTFRSLRLNIEALDLYNNPSDVIATTPNGEIIVLKEGIAKLKISSVLNPEAYDIIYINTIKRITSLTLNETDLGKSSSGLAYQELKIRKGENGQFYAYFENYNKEYNIEYQYTDNFIITYTILVNESDNIIQEVVDEEGNTTSKKVIHITDKLDFNGIKFKEMYMFEFNNEINYIYNKQEALQKLSSEFDFVENGGTLQKIDAETGALLVAEFIEEDNVIKVTQTNGSDVDISFIEILLYSLTADSSVDGLNAIQTYASSKILEGVDFDANDYIVNVALYYSINMIIEGEDNSLKAENSYFEVGDTKQAVQNFDVSIFDGAISIEADIAKTVNAPGDVVELKLTLITDNIDDELIVDDIANFITNLSQLGETVNLEKGKYKKEYTLTIAMIDSFEVKHLTEQFILNLRAYSSLLNEKDLIVPITFVPQKVQKLNLYNYAVNDIKLIDGKTYFNSYGVNDLVLIPNENALLHINLYPYYSCVDLIEVKSDVVDDVSILLEQVVQTMSGYTRLIPQSQATDDRLGLRLQQTSRQTASGFINDGNFYVKMLLLSNVPKGTQFTITVNAYNLDANGNKVLTVTNKIVLLAAEIPQLNVSTATNSLYLVKGVNNQLLVNFKPTSNQQEYRYTITITDKNNDIYYSQDDMDAIFYVKGASEIKDGWQVSKDFIQIGIGVPNGVKITIRYVVKYEINNSSKELVVIKSFIVTDFDIENVSIHSFNNETNSLDMRIQEYYRLGIKSVKFKVASFMFDEVIKTFGYNINDKSTYLGYYYGYFTDGSDRINICRKDDSGELYINNNGEDYILNVVTEKGADGNYVSSYKYLQGEELLDLNTLFNGYTFVNGIYIKMVSAERALANNQNIFTRQTSPNTFESFSEHIDSKNGIYLKLEKNPDTTLGAEYLYYLIGIAPMQNQTMVMSFDYAFNINGELIFNGFDLDSKYEEHSNYSKTYTYNIISQSTIDVPIPVYTQQELYEMKTGENYILMQDISLVEWSPISTSISSLDGNGYSLILQSFNTSTGNLGLFSTVTEDTVLKNLTLNISQLTTTFEMYNFEEVQIGLIAINNEGIITNCTVTAAQINGQSTNARVNELGNEVLTFNILTSVNVNGEMVKVNGGLFVNNNNNAITNSKVNYNNTENGGELSSETEIYFKAAGDIAGFVNLNSGHISASCVFGVNLENNLDVASNSRTAGFVCINTGKIFSSYVRGGTELDSENKIRSVRGLLSSNGSIGGFVYDNNGHIQDCYSNIPITSNARTAGFVFYNQQNGTIENAYSASKITTNTALHMPFIGVDDKSNIQNVTQGSVQNCYYFEDKNENFETSAVNELASKITKSNFGTSSSFAGFAFSEADVYNAIWTMDDGYPELYSANLITSSIRQLQLDETGNIFYIYGVNAQPGTINNPYLIANAYDYNYHFSQAIMSGKRDKFGNYNITDKYFRFIHGIDFASTEASIDALSREVSICNVDMDGNGFAINNVVITAEATQNVESIGLFKRIYSVSESSINNESYKSTVKNLDINLKEGNGVNVSYVGGLSGIIEDSNIFNINISAFQNDNAVIIKGKNVVGGVAGVLRGNSKLFNVNSSVSVEATYRESSDKDFPNYYIAETKDATNVSHAGAVVGVLDILDPAEDIESIAQVQNANVLNITAKGNITINAEYSGGLFGYIGSNTHIFNSDFEVDNSEKNNQAISSGFASGGIVGLNFGWLTQCKIEHSRIIQDEIDIGIANAIVSGGEIDAGKTDLFQGTPVYAGGIIGYNIGGKAQFCYSRVDINDPEPSVTVYENREQYFGGLIGITYGGYLYQSYSTSSLNAKQNTRSYVGGIVGRVEDFNIGILSQTSEEDGEQEQSKYLIIKDIYAINIWSNAESLCRDGGRYAGKIVGYTNSELINPELDSIWNTDEFYRIAYLYEGEGNIFEELPNKTLKLVGDGRYANATVDLFVGVNLDINYLSDYAVLFTQTSTNIAMTQAFYNKLFEDYYIKYPTRDFPIFTAGMKSNEEEIDSASEFINVANTTPYKTLIITKDLDFSDTEIKYSSGPIITKLFTGKVVSGIKSNTDELEIKPVNFYNINLIVNEKMDGIGLFSSMRRATISNVNFHFQSITGSTKNIGLITATDEASSFSNVNVIVDSRKYKINDSDCLSVDNENSEELNNSNPVENSLNETIEYSGISVENANNLGAFSAVSVGTVYLNNCSVTGTFETVGANPTNYELNQGGFLGKAKFVKINHCVLDAIKNKKNIERLTLDDIIKTEVNSTNYMTNFAGVLYKMNLGGIVGQATSTVVANNVTVYADIKVSLNTNSKSLLSANIGGLIGITANATMNNCKVLEPTISVSDISYLNLGGAVGECSNIRVNNLNVGSINEYLVDTITTRKLVCAGINVDWTNKTIKEVNVGGAFGYAVNIKNNSSLNNESNVYANIILNKETSGDLQNPVSVGGFIGKMLNYAAASQDFVQNRINTIGEINIKAVNESFKVVNVGGIIGTNVININVDAIEDINRVIVGNTKLNNSYSLMNITADKIQSLNAGGLVGICDFSDAMVNNYGRFDINNCLTTGFICATNYKNIKAGGLAGSSNGMIENCIVGTTIMANDLVTDGSYDTNKLIGNITGNNSIVNTTLSKVNNIVLVSDLTLSTDFYSDNICSEMSARNEGDSFIIIKQTQLIEWLMDNSLSLLSSDIFEFRYVDLDIWDDNEECVFSEGYSSLNPINVDGLDAFKDARSNETDFKYYLQTEDLNITGADTNNTENNFKGLYNGNTKLIKVNNSSTYTASIFGDINELGAIENFAVVGDANITSSSFVVNNNEGKIYNTLMQGNYVVSNESFAGLVDNNGGIVSQIQSDIYLNAHKSTNFASPLIGTSNRGMVYNCIILGGIEHTADYVDDEVRLPYYYGNSHLCYGAIIANSSQASAFSNGVLIANNVYSNSGNVSYGAFGYRGEHSKLNHIGITIETFNLIPHDLDNSDKSIIKYDKTTYDLNSRDGQYRYYYLRNIACSAEYNYGYPYFDCFSITGTFGAKGFNDNEKIIIETGNGTDANPYLINNLSNFYRYTNDKTIALDYKLKTNLIQLKYNKTYKSSIDGGTLDGLGNCLLNLNISEDSTFTSISNANVSNLYYSINFNNMANKYVSIFTRSIENSILTNVHLLGRTFVKHTTKIDESEKAETIYLNLLAKAEQNTIVSYNTKYVGVAGFAVEVNNSRLNNITNNYFVNGNCSGQKASQGVAGLVVNLNDSELIGCRNAANIYNNGVLAKTSTKGGSVAGLVYYANKSTIKECQNSGTIYAGNGTDGVDATQEGGSGAAGGDGGDAGGIICNSNNTTITKCTNEGTIIGGNGGDGGNGKKGKKAYHGEQYRSNDMNHRDAIAPTPGGNGGKGGDSGYVGGIVAVANGGAITSNRSVCRIESGNGGAGGNGGDGGDAINGQMEFNFFDCYGVKDASCGGKGGDGGNGGTVNTRYGGIVGNKTDVNIKNNNYAINFINGYNGKGGNGGAGMQGGSGAACNVFFWLVHFSTYAGGGGNGGNGGNSGNKMADNRKIKGEFIISEGAGGKGGKGGIGAATNQAFSNSYFS